MARAPRAVSDYSQDWRDVVLAAKWDKVRDLRRVVTGALEIARADKKIGASAAGPSQGRRPGALVAIVRDLPMDDICITSDITIVEGAPSAEAYTLPDVPVSRGVELAHRRKMPALLEVLPTIGKHRRPGVCQRCDGAIGLMAAE